MSPRAWRTLRRLVLCFASFLLVCTTTGWGSGDNIFPHRLGLPWTREENPGPCQFVSPMEAYRNDLARLQRIHASRGAHGQAQRPLLHDFNESHAHSHAHQHHTFSTNGHLLVSPDSDAPHPIPLLLSVGEKKWEDLLSRQSTTLEEAVEEYTRRYGRRPPKGFDIWWDFAEVFNLVLPDEYDRINLDLAPFFALPKEEMKRRMLMVEDMPETFTVIIKDGRVDVQILDPGGLRWEGTWPRARDAASLIEGFARFLPDLRVTFSIFDQPQIYLSWARRKSLMELGLRNEHTSHLHEIDDIEIKLSRSCSPDSNLRQSGQNLSSGKSFIHDNLQAADICQNPYLVPLHGLTIEHHAATSHPRPHTHLLPLFSLAKTSINSDILITPLDQFFDKPGHDPKWERKKSSKLAWRGSPTGISTMTSDLPWRDSHRVRLHHHANNKSSAPAEVMVPHLGSNPYDGLELGQTQEVLSVKKMNDFFFDMKLAGRPLQCMEDDGTCADMQEEIDFAPFQSSDDLNKHKFLLDIDGNGWSGRFRRLMRTNSLVIKTSLFTEWFQPHLIPWFMYVPAKLDFSDLPDILAFFRGSPKHPDMGFDETAKAIAKNGQCFAQRMFRLEDLQAYMLRLLLEYARLAADDGVDMVSA
ncbi:glycosyl transferase family 90-domain-containing protein [Kockovaella imperatae]|uniref:Glycosyl transferase family 90-domain-containing protein n=1 Tax=Kockovaella imperatae TaxID=4999 RepID=A0A1Y1UIG9_9TREE|nr:glycosyl transferase family 90-domain-containing protein [Kockovaella imperatae]ORX37296.1 glycosyl transferase family 90-domain-containing protein [Kockovaella imperatae]